LRQYLIIGTGVAGVAAAGALRRADASAGITMVGEDPHGFYSRPGLAYFLTDEIPEKQLYIFSKRDWQALNLHLVRTRVRGLLSQSHKVQLHNGEMRSYDRLLLATGSTAVPLTIPGADLQGVVKLDDFEDALGIRKLARRARTAVVVGGGIVAMELVEGLAALGLKVHYFLRGDRYWSNVLDEVESRIVERRLVHEGIQLHYRTEIAEILGRGGRVAGVRTTDGEKVTCELVAVGIGVRSRIDLARGAGLHTERGILVDEHLQTSDPDIFAAGDVAQVLDLQTGRSTLDTLWSPAREEGAAAGAGMAGDNTPFRKLPIVNIARLAGMITTIIGAVGSGQDADQVDVARGSSETWQASPDNLVLESGAEVNHLRLMVGEQIIAGAVLMGDQTVSVPLQDLILTRADITPIREQLLHPRVALGQVLLDFWAKGRAHAQGK
jgi:NAD(P)H-nitrite reductase large subunit